MAKKDIFHNVTVGTFTSGTAIDLLGYNGFAFAAVMSASDTVAVKLEESDDNSTFVDCTANQLLGAASQTGTLIKFGYKGDKRYLKITLTITGNATATGVSVFGAPLVAPTE